MVHTTNPPHGANIIVHHYREQLLTKSKIEFFYIAERRKLLDEQLKFVRCKFGNS